LLGVNGVVTIGHGSSNVEAVKNAIIYTNNSVNKEFISDFTSEIEIT
jgi:fatty acid/phospholipid biosynthesis enzyme